MKSKMERTLTSYERVKYLRRFMLGHKDLGMDLHKRYLIGQSCMRSMFATII